MKTSDIRNAFFDYFKAEGHTIVPSSTLVPVNDATLLFTNAGMVQFKDTFLGITPLPYSRAVSAQRCLRAGGKHNDLDNVGYTARHHTFFEMLGNFSFGDYFKREAIQYSWNFLTKVLKLPVERLWITVYREDDEAAAIWLNEIGISPTRISRCDEADNFWSMGDTGPCGPCSEIFYDHGPDVPGGPPGHPGSELDRYVEIWNLVFMQYNRDKNGTLHPLPKKSVDTGMGLERIAAVMQGVHSNYQIDLFANLIAFIASQVEGVQKDHPSLNVIADHIRACAFLIADGVLPGNEGRGYVLRRIIRRAVRHGYQLGLPLPFFHTLVAPLIAEMGEAYPELVARQTAIEDGLKKEELQFARTLSLGMQLLNDQLEELTGNVLPGEIAFKLYDTYGFPLDLTADSVREKGLTIDEAGFAECMQKQRLQSQQSNAFHADYSQHGTVDVVSVFQGYTQEVFAGKVIEILADGATVTHISVGMQVGVILDATPFYAESGGQVGDQGLLLANGCRFFVENTKRLGQAIVHYGFLEEGTLALHDEVMAEINVKRRQAIRINHTATHLLHAALKEIIGTHVEQRGSLVDAERARFDFSHGEALTELEINAIELLVNSRIRLDELVETEVMSLDAASKSGALALFGEKYGSDVRVLSIGSFSKELCGGTHARRTGELGLFKITAEYGVASGVRRLEWVSGEEALLWTNTQLAQLNQMASLLKTTVAEVVPKLSQSLLSLKQSEKELQELQKKLTMQDARKLLADVKHQNGVAVLIKQLNVTDQAQLRLTLDELRSRLSAAVIVLFSIHESQISVVASVSNTLQGRVPSAAEWVRQICGKGGGRFDMAQGGGPVPIDFVTRLEGLDKLIT